MGIDSRNNSDKVEYVVSESDARAIMKRTGFVEITKVDNQNELIPGVKFDLTREDGTVFRTGITNDKGKLVLRGLPVGEYTLKEVSAPDGYIQSTKEYKVSVYKESGAFCTSVDSKTVVGTDGDKNTEFTFKVTINDLSGEYNYTASEGKEDGTVNFINGVAEFTLMHDQYIVISDLPAGLEYRVEERANPNFDIAKSGETGVIIKDTICEVSFVNTKKTPPAGEFVPPPEDPKDPPEEEPTNPPEEEPTNPPEEEPEEDPKTPPEEKPSDTPKKPVKVTVDDLPDPKDSHSPDYILVYDGDTPLGYFHKIDEEYFDEEGVPLSWYLQNDVPRTGDEMNLGCWLLLMMSAFAVFRKLLKNSKKCLH